MPDITIEHGEEVVLYRRAHNAPERKPPFFICGTGSSNNYGESMDVIDTLATLPGSSIKLFNRMLKARDVDSNVVRLVGKDVADKMWIQNHMPAVIESGLVRRVSRGVFMINPDAVMPPRYRTVKNEWEGLS